MPPLPLAPLLSSVEQVCPTTLCQHRAVKHTDSILGSAESLEIACAGANVQQNPTFELRAGNLSLALATATPCHTWLGLKLSHNEASHHKTSSSSPSGCIAQFPSAGILLISRQLYHQDRRTQHRAEQAAVRCCQRQTLSH